MQLLRLSGLQQHEFDARNERLQQILAVFSIGFEKDERSENSDPAREGSASLAANVALLAFEESEFLQRIFRRRFQKLHIHCHWRTFDRNPTWYPIQFLDGVMHAYQNNWIWNYYPGRFYDNPEASVVAIAESRLFFSTVVATAIRPQIGAIFESMRFKHPAADDRLLFERLEDAILCHVLDDDHIDADPLVESWLHFLDERTILQICEAHRGLDFIG